MSARPGALVLGAIPLVAIMAVIIHFTYPKEMVERARQHAAKAGEKGGMRGDPTEGLPEGWRQKLRSREAWRRVGVTLIGEWRMVWKDLFFGFLIAGAVATLVPDKVFQAVFPSGLSPLLLVPIHALLGPVLAIATVIGSMGNGPLAAVLWENGVLFAGIMAFLYADFVVLPSLHINAKYYGWRFAGYLALVFTASAVGAGIVMHAAFWALRLSPEPKAGRVVEMAKFSINYDFFLNLAAIILSVVLVWLGWRGRSSKHRPAPVVAGGDTQSP